MKLSSIERYEIRAEAFRWMTNHMAPGKDVAAAAYGQPYEVRAAAWEVWCDAHNKCVDAVLHAIEVILEREAEEEGRG